MSMSLSAACSASHGQSRSTRPRPPAPRTAATPRSHRARLGACLLVAGGLAGAPAPAQQVVQVLDFTQGDLAWIGSGQAATAEPSTEGLVITATGADPWVESTEPLAIPNPDRAHRVTMRLRTTAGPGFELFHGSTFTAAQSARIIVPGGGEWVEASVVLPSMDALTRLRLDPPAGESTTVLQSVTITELPRVDPPALPPFAAPTFVGDVLALSGEGLELRHNGREWGGFSVSHGGQPLAIGSTSDVLGLWVGEELQWLPFSSADVTVTPRKRALLERAVFAPEGGPQVVVTREIEPDADAGKVDFRVEVTASADARLHHIPWGTVLAGAGEGGFGASKTQGLLAGAEYLGDEPSSSSVDIETADHDRRVAAPWKITMPLMGVAAQGKTVGVLWGQGPHVQQVFDSPDRTLGSGGHLMAVWGPAVGEHRLERDLWAMTPMALAAGEPLGAEFSILAGEGESVVPMIQQAVAAMGGFPPIPEPMPRQRALEILAAGWLQSGLADLETGQWRHALWQGFGPGWGADAALHLMYLSQNLEDPELKDGAFWASEGDLQRRVMGPEAPDPANMSRLGHVHTLAPELAFNGYRRMEQALQARAERLPARLAAFREDGTIPYARDPKREDYSRGHYSDTANGYSATPLMQALVDAAVVGDQQHIDKALDVLDRLNATHENGVPRGAQTWELSLHTPDILACAAMTRCNVIAHKLTGEDGYLENARYWAWTAVPFIYLVQPTPGDIGLYATIAVYGATSWVAPLWIGQPVQWCGLVHAAVLHELASVDDSAPWAEIAKGIATVGMQMTWDESDEERQGLLPDYVVLEPQLRDGPAINPATVLAVLPPVYGGTTWDHMVVARRSGAIIHAMRPVEVLEEGDGVLVLRAGDWGGVRPTRLLLTRLPATIASVELRPAGSDEPFAPSIEFGNIRGFPAATIPVDQDMDVRVTFTAPE